MLPILHQSYWRDEAFSVLLSSHNLKDIFWLTLKDTHPPLYYFLLHFWINLFGDAEYITRTLSLLFHFLLVLTSFYILKHLLKNWKIATIGSLAVLLNPFLLEYAFEVRSYSLFGLLVATTTLFYLKRRYLICSIFLTLMLLTHNFGLFFLAGFLTHWLAINHQHIKQTLWQSVSLFLLPVIGIFAWLQILWNQWAKVAGGFWIQTQSSSIFVNAFRKFFQGNLDYPSKDMLYNLTLTLTFMAGAYWLIKATKTDQPGKPNQSGILLSLFSLPFLIVYIISAFWVPIYHERFLLPVLPMLIIWTVFSLIQLSYLKQSMAYAVVGLSAAYLLFSLQSAEEIIRKTTKPAINFGITQILSQAQDGDVIVPESNLNFLETKYYVLKSGKNIPVYALSKTNGEDIPFYVGKVLFNQVDIISQYPENTNVWIVTPDGAHYLKTPGENQL